MSSGSSQFFLRSIFFPFFGSAAPQAFFRPGHGFLGRPRAGAVKVGRRTDINSHCVIARPYLDGGEHGGILPAMGRLAGMLIRGEPALAVPWLHEPSLYSV
ncbi:MAG: hypothetical protein WAK69_02170 [Rhodoplanes sp.]